MDKPTESTLPLHTKEEGDKQPDAEKPAAQAEGEAAGPSKNALKKAAKEKAKAEKAAQRAAQQQAAAQASQAEDTATHLYGKMPDSAEVEDVMNLMKLSDEHYEKEITVIARVDNARVQSAKLAFLMLRQQGKKIQAVIALKEPLSRQMIKWTGQLNVNSIVQVSGVVKKPEIPVHSASLPNMELHITKIYMISEAIPMLPMQVKDAERPPPESTEEGLVDTDGTPIVTLKTRLDNRILDLQTETSQAIMAISSGVAQLFSEYMLKSGSRWIFTSKITGAATEGGSGVFEISYFKRKAYLSQSPQLGKQMCIAGDMMSVFEIGPVFRAEDSNTHRHLTEVRQNLLGLIILPSQTNSKFSSLVSISKGHSKSITTKFWISPKISLFSSCPNSRPGSRTRLPLSKSLIPRPESSNFQRMEKPLDLSIWRLWVS